MWPFKKKTQQQLQQKQDYFELARGIYFDLEVFDLIQSVTNAEIKRMNKYSDIGDGKLKDEYEDAIEFHAASEEHAKAIVSKLKPHLLLMGYIIFLSERLYKNGATIGVIKSDDQYDLLRIKYTNGVNYNITNDDIISRLKKWEEKYKFDIIGADYDWVEIEFKNTPSDDELMKFAKEVYEFCPDSVDQGVGSVEALAEEIDIMGSLFLWWD